MSSSPITPTSTTGSSASLSSRTNVIACGALAGHIRDIAARRGWELAVHNLPASLQHAVIGDLGGGQGGQVAVYRFG